MKPQRYRDNPHYRHWWWHRIATPYVPWVYRGLDPSEQDILDAWFDETEKSQMIGEMCVPLASLLVSLVNGNDIRRVVQLGHYAGFSTLVLGFCLRSMNAPRSLWSVDINPGMTRYTQGWLDRAKLQDFVRLHVSCSADPKCPGVAAEYLGGQPTLVIVDSSHMYEHTTRELPLWYEALSPGGLMVLHDTSEVARGCDNTNQGGVPRALEEWLPTIPLDRRCLLMNHQTATPGCIDRNGIGVIQKPGGEIP